MRLEIARASAACCLIVAGCGGGGGPPAPPPPTASISVSADQIAFTTPGPWAVTTRPPNQRLTASVQGTINGTLTILIQVNNPELVSVGNVLITGPNTGEATVTAADPATLQIGAHTGSIVVRACVNDPQCNSNHLQGSPKTIAISYDIPTNLRGDSLTPRVVAANAVGEVILRGRNFPTAATVSFGSASAASVNVVSSSEIRATHPPLAPGNYSVAINAGSVAFSGALSVVAETSYAPVFLPNPPGTAHVLSLDFDEERQAIFAGLLPAGAAEPKLIRYAYEGTSWGAPTLVDVTGLPEQVRLAPDGSRLLVLRTHNIPVDSSIDEFDPMTLDAGASTALPVSLRGNAFVFVNDGSALVAIGGSGSQRQYLYAVGSREFVLLDQFLTSFAAVASLDGSRAILFGDGGNNLLYDASSGRIRNVPSSVSGSGQARPSANRTGSRIQSGTAVYDSELRAIGYTPGSHVAAVINGTGTRLYSAFPGDTNDPLPQLYAYDVDAPTSGGQQPLLSQVAGPIPLPDDPGLISTPSPEMAISADGRTLFIGGFRGIVVMPAP
jgi:hypothetical protein